MRIAQGLHKPVVDPQVVVKLWKFELGAVRSKALVESGAGKPLSQDVGYCSRQPVCILNECRCGPHFAEDGRHPGFSQEGQAHSPGSESRDFEDIGNSIAEVFGEPPSSGRLPPIAGVVRRTASVEPGVCREGEEGASPEHVGLTGEMGTVRVLEDHGSCSCGEK